MRRLRSNSSLLQAGDEAGTLRVSDIQKSCFRVLSVFVFFVWLSVRCCLVFLRLVRFFINQYAIYGASVRFVLCFGNSIFLCVDLGIFAIVFAKLLWYLRLKNQTYAEILECSILHRFGFERSGYGDGRREWRAWVCRRKRSRRLAISLNRFFFCNREIFTGFSMMFTSYDKMI